MNGIKIKIILICLGLFLASSIVFASPDWYNFAWAYRVLVTITGSSADLTDYQVKVTVDWDAGRMNSDFSDIRFTDLDGVNLLPHWRESYTEFVTADFWVKVPSIPSSGATIYMYYGNPSALSARDGETTFEFFDGFEGGSLDITKWDAENSLASVSASNLNLNPNGINGAYIKSSQTFGPDVAIKARTFFVDEYANNKAQFLGVAASIGEVLADINNPTTWYNHIYANIYYSLDERNVLSVGTSTSMAEVYGEKWVGAWAVLEMTWKDGEVNFYNNDVLQSIATQHIPTVSVNPKLVYQHSGTGIMRADWYLVRKYTDPEPSVIVVEDIPVVLISRDPAGTIYSSDIVTVTSIASDASGLYNHKIQKRVNGEPAGWETIFDCYDADSNCFCDDDNQNGVPFEAGENSTIDIGLISKDIGPFNVGDVVEYRSSATDYAEPPNTGWSADAEESFTVINNPPEASNLIIEAGPVYCGIEEGTGQVSFKWNYSDADGDPQARFDFRINDINNINDPNPEVDRRFCADSNTQTRIIISSLVSSPHTYCCLAEDNLDCSGIYTVNVPDALAYNNTTYYWWVRVWDDQGDNSGWVAYPSSFTTKLHPYPWPNFTPVPQNPKVGELVNFIDASKCYSSDAEDDCKNNSDNDYFWDFGDGNTTTTVGNVAHHFAPAKDYVVALTVTDADGLGTCSYDVSVPVQLPVPEWREKRP